MMNEDFYLSVDLLAAQLEQSIEDIIHFKYTYSIEHLQATVIPTGEAEDKIKRLDAARIALFEQLFS